MCSLQLQGHGARAEALVIACASLAVWLAFAGTAFAQSSVAPEQQTGPSTASPDGSPDASDTATGTATTPPGTPDVLDGLESLKLAKEPDFGPPIIDGNDLYLGSPYAGAAGSGGSSSAFMKPLDADLSTPDLAAPSLQTGLEAAPLDAPNQQLPLLEIPNIAGPSMTGLTMESFGPPSQNRPLGTIGAPRFLNAKRSFSIGNSRVRYGVEVAASVAYNNNVFGANKNPQADMIMTLQPTFYLETGKKGTMQFLWAPSVLQYAKYKQLNSVNQAFLFSSRYRWSKLRVGLDASYLAQSGLFLNSQGQSQQKSVFVQIFGGYALTKKTDAILSFSGGVTDSNPGGKQFQGTLNASVDYKYSSKTTVGAGLALSYFYSATGMTTSESFLLRLLYNPTSKLVIRGEGGLEFRQSSSTAGGSSSASTSVINLSAIYRPSSKTYVSLRFFRSVDMDAFNSGNLQITTSVETAASWRFSHTTTLDGGLSAGRVENVSLSGQNTGTFNFVQANVAVSYMLSDEVNLRLFNNLQQKMNDTQGNNYMSNTSGMSLGMRF
jgi:hypothetical protein